MHRIKLSSEVRTEELGKWRRYGIGIDVHSLFAYAVIMVPNYAAGTAVVYETQFDVSPEGVRDGRVWMLTCLRENGIEDTAPLYCIESTATYHCPVVRNLGGQAIVLNPYIARASLKKTDKFDARTMAYHCMTGLYEPSYIATGNYLALRVLCRTIESWRKQITAHFSTIMLRLTEEGLPVSSLKLSPGSAVLRPILEDWANGRIQPASFPDSVREVLSLQKVAESTLSVVRHAYEIVGCIERSISDARKRASSLVDVLEWWTAAGAVSGARIYKLLLGIPGIGDGTALCFISEVCDIRRFASADKLCAYSGFDPSRRVSAGKVTSAKTRPGNPRLRHHFIQCANLILNRPDHPLGAWGLALVGRSCRSVAVVAVGRRLVRVCYSVARSAQSYMPERLGNPAAQARVAILDVLPKRVCTALKKEGIVWLDELVSRDLKNVPGIGEATAKLIQRWLTAYGFTAESPVGGGEKSS
jgi:transposase